MLRWHARTSWVAGTLVFAAFALAAPRREAVKPYSVYHDGAGLVFAPESTGTRRAASFGPWELGDHLVEQEKPRDNRLNLYVVVPGSQYRSPARPDYDHNRVINKYTVDGKARDWDVFWCLVLDPSLHEDLRSERDLLVATAQTFKPADLFEVQDIPSHTIMKDRVGIKSVADLRRFRKKDGSLPRLVIVPARLAVRATAEVQDVVVDHPKQ